MTDYREPDLATLVRICRVLGIRPDEVLCFDPAEEDDLARQRRSVTGFAEVMDRSTLPIAVAIMQALAATPGLRGPPDPPTKVSRAGRQVKPGPATKE